MKPITYSLKLVTLLLILLVTCLIPTKIVNATTLNTTNYIPLIILPTSESDHQIGDEFYLYEINAKDTKAKYKSSNPSIASVSADGLVTAHKDGSALITVTYKDVSATCKIKINKTKIYLNTNSITIDDGESIFLNASSSNQVALTYKSSKESIATINDSGIITAKKPGVTTITIKANTTTKRVTVKVRQPMIKLSTTSIHLVRNESYKLTADISCIHKPRWKSNNKSVAIVDEEGNVTAIKHGTATITATVDGVKKSCTVTVKSPTIQLNRTEMKVKVGETKTLTATVSSQNIPTWYSSNTNVVSVCNGKLTAHKKGTAYVYAKEDGAKARCKVIVSSD